MDFPQKLLLSGEKIFDAVLENKGKDYSKLVNVSRHKSLPLASFCYSSLCNLGDPSDPCWDEITVSCRGIIINTDTKEIVSKPWNKFFNYNPEFHKHNITDNSYILEKLDGSLGISYREPGSNRIRIATKNSFDNEMTTQANAWLDKKIEEVGWDFFPKSGTFLFEIIYPENYSTIINYGDRRECVLLGIINTKTGREFDFEATESFGLTHNISTPKQYSFKSFISVVEHCKTLPWNNEGYVITLPQNENCKYKLKGTKFIEIHRLAFGLGPHRIWRCVKDGVDVPEMLKDLPEEVKKPKLDTYYQIINERDKIVNEAEKCFEEIFSTELSRKEFAMKVQELPKPMRGLMFSMYDGKPEKAKDCAMKQIEDQYKQKEEINTE